MRSTIRLLALVLGSWACLVLAQDAEPAAEAEAEVSPLGIRQDGVRRTMVELEGQIVRLITVLQESNPEQAERLKRALQAAKARQIAGRMDEIKGLLDKQALDQALDRQEAVGGDLEELLKILLDDKSEYERLQERIEQLEGWKGRTEELAREEWAEKRASERAADPDAKQRLGDQIQRLQALVQRQSQLQAATEQATAEGSPNLPQMAEQQDAIQQETEALARELHEQSDTAGKRPETVAPEPGQEQLEKAGEHQQQAEQEMAASKGKSAQSQQAQALQQMQQALAAMQQQLAQMQQPGEQQQQQMQEAQEQTAEATEALEQEMAQEEEQSAEAQPGQQSVQQAQQQMQQAQQQLGQQQNSQASQSQGQAQQQLAKAAEQMQEEIDRLREEQRTALLEELQAMLQEMLMRQQRTTVATAALEQRQAAKKWRREEQLACLRWQKEESEIGEIAGKALAMIRENGDSAVFGAVLEEIQGGLAQVAGRLGEYDTGKVTQLRQKDIERLIEDLLQALDDNQEFPDQEPQEPQEPPPGQGASPEQPLISQVAELKLLRAAQLRVNQRTREVDRAARGEELGQAALAESLQEISGRQVRVLNMARKLMGEDVEEVTP